MLELIGGCDTARELVLKAIASGKHVVTANKALLAKHGEEVAAAARQQGVCVGFEASVAGGIPIVKSLGEGLSANRIEWLAGIINGTGNFILTEMRDNGSAFDEVLTEAQRLGYAEADPTFDVEGIDAAHKLVILASLAFSIPLSFESCFTEGIATVELQDIEFARELGYQVKHLGIARKRGDDVELRVHPTLIPKGRLLANVDGVMNAVVVKGDAVGPTLYYGAGAGAEPTASAVLADVVDIASHLATGSVAIMPALDLASQSAGNAVNILPVSDIRSAYYLRMSVLDKPGVMNKMTRLFGDANISIEALKQPEMPAGSEEVPVILITDVAVERDMLAVIEQLEALEEVCSVVKYIRIESLG